MSLTQPALHDQVPHQLPCKYQNLLAFGKAMCVGARSQCQLAWGGKKGGGEDPIADPENDLSRPQ